MSCIASDRIYTQNESKSYANESKEEELKYTRAQTYIDRSIQNLKEQYPEKYLNAKRYGETLMDRMERNGILGEQQANEKVEYDKQQTLAQIKKDMLQFGDLYDPLPEELEVLLELIGTDWKIKLNDM